MAGMGGNISSSFMENPSLCNFSVNMFLVMVVSFVQNLTGKPADCSLQISNTKKKNSTDPFVLVYSIILTRFYLSARDTNDFDSLKT